MTIIDLINKYLGIPYKDCGRTIKSGLDCWGLVLLAIKDLYNIELPDTTNINYSPKNLLKHKTRVFDSYNIDNWVEKIETPKYGDLILLSTIYNLPIHVGIFINSTKMLHASIHKGVVVEPLERYKNKIVGYYRVKAK